MFPQSEIDKSPVLADALVKLNALKTHLEKVFGRKYRLSYSEIPTRLVDEPNLILEIKPWRILAKPLVSIGCKASGSWFFVLYKDGRIDPRLPPWLSACEFMSQRYKVYFGNEKRIVWR